MFAKAVFEHQIFCGYTAPFANKFAPTFLPYAQAWDAFVGANLFAKAVFEHQIFCGCAGPFANKFAPTFLPYAQAWGLL
ncbi:hypothetical protein AL062_08790 [Pseudomonas syringae pv. syringae]|nr:hypothetical protein AL062_08790 [Pseudomonas syringae pv. syringae]